MHQFNEIVRIATATLVMFTVLSLASNLKQGKHLCSNKMVSTQSSNSHTIQSNRPPAHSLHSGSWPMVNLCHKTE